MRRLVVLALLVASAACSGPRAISVEITSGHESDAFGRAPAVEKVAVTLIGVDGSTRQTATASPGQTFSLGELPTDELIHVEATGSDSSGSVQLRGRSLGVVLGALEGDLLPVFAQRVDSWARPPGGLPSTHHLGRAVVLGERFLLLAGGDGRHARATDAVFYDLLALGGSSGGSFALAPRSMVVSRDGRAVLLIDDSRALWVDFDSGASLEVSLPSGLGSFSQVAGGRTVAGPKADYVVGATRTSEPTDRVLIIEHGGTIRGAQLGALRSGAAATWIPDVGLAVAGGSTDAPGIELLRQDASRAVLLPYPPDPTRGAAAVPSRTGELMLLGGSVEGVGPMVRFAALECAENCLPRDGAASLDEPTDGCQAFGTAGPFLLVCQDASGATRSWAVESEARQADELLLREPRRGASVVASPNGSLALLGGERLDGAPALSVEIFFPPE